MPYCWWTIRDSNSRPLRCERSALPTELQARPVTQQNPQQRAPADGVIIAQFPRLVKGFAKKSRAVALQLCFPTTAEGINRRYTNEGGTPGQLVHECADDSLIACIAVDIGADERHIYEVVGIIE